MSWQRAPGNAKGDWAWGHSDRGEVAFRAAQQGVTVLLIKGPKIEPGSERVSAWVRRVVEQLLAART